MDYMTRFQNDLDGAEELGYVDSAEGLQRLLEEEDSAGLDLTDSFALEREDSQRQLHERELERMQLMRRQLAQQQKVAEEQENEEIVMNVSEVWACICVIWQYDYHPTK